MSNDTENTPEPTNHTTKRQAIEAAIRVLESAVAAQGLTLRVAIFTNTEEIPVTWHGDTTSADHVAGLCQGAAVRAVSRIQHEEAAKLRAKDEASAELAKLQHAVAELKQQVRAHTVALQADARSCVVCNKPFVPAPAADPYACARCAPSEIGGALLAIAAKEQTSQPRPPDPPPAPPGRKVG